MSTLAEIEAAVQTLPRSEQERLFAFLAKRIGHAPELPGVLKDPVESIIGAFAGRREATGRRAEEILYGAGE